VAQSPLRCSRSEPRLPAGRGSWCQRGAPSARHIADRFPVQTFWTRENILTQTETHIGAAIDMAASKGAYLRRQACSEEIVFLSTHRTSIVGIADHLRLSRSTVYTAMDTGAFPERAHVLCTKRLLNPSHPSLEKRLAQGGRTANQFLPELVAHGFIGRDILVTRWLAPQREKPGHTRFLNKKRSPGFHPGGRRRHLFPATRVRGHTQGPSPGRIGSIAPSGLASVTRHILSGQSGVRHSLPHLRAPTH
jgi:hypothetical protein